MPAEKEEIEEAIKEGIEIQYLTAPVKIRTKDGCLEQLECVKMELGDMDKSGRRRPVPLKGSEFTIKLDTLVAAISQQPKIEDMKDKELKFSKWNTIEIDPETLYTGKEGVFAGGDAVHGPWTVTGAMSHGKIAANMIDKYVSGQKLEREYGVTRPAMDVCVVELSEEEIDNLKRSELPKIAVSKRASNFNEVELGFNESQAISEAKHCLRCDKEE